MLLMMFLFRSSVRLNNSVPFEYGHIFEMSVYAVLVDHIHELVWVINFENSLWNRGMRMPRMAHVDLMVVMNLFICVTCVIK